MDIKYLFSLIWRPGKSVRHPLKPHKKVDLLFPHLTERVAGNEKIT